MAHAPLILTPEAVADLHRLRERATAAPIDMLWVQKAITTKPGLRTHLERMAGLTTTIPGPWPFDVTFSIEHGHPVGPCRHMSMSVRRKGRVPHPLALGMVMPELGFVGGVEECLTWPEKSAGGGTAINVLEPLTSRPSGTSRERPS